MFQISEVQESPAFNGRRSFLALRATKVERDSPELCFPSVSGVRSSLVAPTPLKLHPIAGLAYRPTGPKPKEHRQRSVGGLDVHRRNQRLVLRLATGRIAARWAIRRIATDAQKNNPGSKMKWSRGDDTQSRAAVGRPVSHPPFEWSDSSDPMSPHI